MTFSSFDLIFLQCLWLLSLLIGCRNILAPNRKSSLLSICHMMAYCVWLLAIKYKGAPELLVGGWCGSMYNQFAGNPVCHRLEVAECPISTGAGTSQLE